MTSRWTLDTNVCIHVIRVLAADLRERSTRPAHQLDLGNYLASGLDGGEVGAAAQHQLAAVEQSTAGSRRCRLPRRPRRSTGSCAPSWSGGQPVGAYDMLIGAHAAAWAGAGHENGGSSTGSVGCGSKAGPDEAGLMAEWASGPH